jgi:hypothetical protein
MQESRFTPSPTKKVRFVNKDNGSEKVVALNRKQRRRMGIHNKKKGTYV